MSSRDYRLFYKEQKEFLTAEDIDELGLEGFTPQEAADLTLPQRKVVRAIKKTNGSIDRALESSQNILKSCDKIRELIKPRTSIFNNLLNLFKSRNRV